MPIWTISQNTYPRLTIVGNDTIVQITPLQLKKANMIFARADYLEQTIKKIDSVAAIYKAQYNNSILINQQHEKTERLLKMQLKALRKQNSISGTHYKELLKIERKKKRRHVIVGTLSGVVAGLLLGVFLVH